MLTMSVKNPFSSAGRRRLCWRRSWRLGRCGPCAGRMPPCRHGSACASRTPAGSGAAALRLMPPETSLSTYATGEASRNIKDSTTCKHPCRRVTACSSVQHRARSRLLNYPDVYLETQRGVDPQKCTGCTELSSFCRFSCAMTSHAWRRDQAETRLVRVDICSTKGGVLIVNMSHQTAGFAPYRLDNCSSEVLHVR